MVHEVLLLNGFSLSSFSDFPTISCGVPQGRVFSSLLFLLYVNDFHISSPKVILLLFADDFCLFHSSKNINILPNDLNDSLNNIANWLKANKLTLNMDKSSLIKFGQHRDCNNENKLTIRIGDEKLQEKILQNI